MTECKRHFRLAVTINELLINLHICTVAQNTLNHGSDLRRRTALQLGVDTGGVLLYMPVNHDAASLVPNMPFGQEIGIPRADLLGIRSTGRRAFSQISIFLTRSVALMTSRMADRKLSL